MTYLLRFQKLTSFLKGIKHILSHVQCRGKWFNLMLKSIENNSLKLSGVPLPGFPDKEIQTNTTGMSGPEALCEAYIFHVNCMKVFSSSPAFVRKDRKLLDFGVGWGRILRFFMKDFEPDNLFGVDVNDELLNICKATFQWGTFIKNNPLPPLDMPDQSIDFIVGYSVFSHLSEGACREWIKEFSRILRPGGMVALTTRGRWFLDYCQSLKDREGYGNALSNLFDDFDRAKQRYDRGEFLHSNIEGVSGGGPLDESFYGETFIPEEYAKKMYCEYFNVLNYKYTMGRPSHPIMLFQK